MVHRRSLVRFSRAATILVAALSASVAVAQGDFPDRRIDPETGRDTAVWPPSPTFDLKHMRLELDFPDVNAPAFAGVARIDAAARGSPRDRLTLDAGPGLTIRGVEVDGRPSPYERSEAKMIVRFDPPSPVGVTRKVTVTYDADVSKQKGSGLTFSKAKPDAKSPSDQVAQFHAQGEPESNHLWFPCHDFPNERLTTELVVTVEDGYDVCSNGSLVSKTSNGGRTTWHWLQDKDHVIYLVTLVIGKFDIVDIGGSATARPGLPMNVYAPIGTADDARQIFSETPAMIAFFERRFEEPYPWAKYDQLIVRDFAAGGMENTSATLLYRAAIRGSSEDQRDLISHELAHQWFGDYVTCRGWAHLWLNEGWATFSESLWSEQAANVEAAGLEVTRATEIAPPTEAGRKAYLRSVLGSLRGQRASNRGFAPVYPAIVSHHYNDPNENFMKGDNPYGKGAVVLHMLRAGLGDEAFFKGVILYLDRFAFGLAETDDFRRCFEEASGKSLERFFNQWTTRPGLPRLEIDLDFADDTGQLTVDIEQVQQIDPLNPTFVFSLPLLCKFEDGGFEYVYVDVNARTARGVFSLRSRPSQVSVDPGLTVAASNKVRKPLAMWIDELRHPASPVAELAAFEHLMASAAGSKDVFAAFFDLASDPGRETQVRDAAATVLAASDIARGIRSILGARPSGAEVASR